nr:PREDICTED: uncharacterized protein LOC109033204 [Bemisia tabaci]
MMFVQRVVDDFKQKKLLSMKLIFFVQSSTLFVLYPYLTIHMRELGLNVEETAIMSALTPIVTIIMPPIAGMIADFIGNFKVLLALFSALGGLASLLLLAIPVGRVTIVYPEQALFRIGCSNDTGYPSLIPGADYPCNPFPNATSSPYEIAGHVEACGLVCRRPNSLRSPVEGSWRTPSAETQAILRARSYKMKLLRPSGQETVYDFNVDAEDIPAYRSRVLDDPDPRNGRILINSGRFPTAIRELSHDVFFFPARGLWSLSCDPDPTRVWQCQVKEAGNLSNSATDGQFPFSGVLDVHEEGMKLVALRRWGLLKASSSPLEGIMESKCGKSKVPSMSETLSVPLLNPENSLKVDALLEMEDCEMSCLATIPRKSICTNLNKVVEYDPQLTFWAYLSVRVTIAMITGTAFAMFEGAAIAILREEKADYGLQRLYAQIGGMISSPMAGYLIDYASKGKGYTDFRPAFYFYAALKTTTAFLMLTINLEFKAPAKNVVADVVEVLKKVEIMALLFAIFIMGTAWGYIESFLFWLLQDLGASRVLMGSTITVGGLAGMPLLIMSGPIVEKIGHANVLFLGFVFYAIRLVGYSLIVKPWQCLIFEAMESVTSSLAFTAAVTYAAKLSNTSTDSSIQGILGGLYYGVGKGAGGLFGGYLMKAFGTRATYRIFAVLTLVTGCMYYLLNQIYIVGRSISQIESGPASALKDKKKMESENSALKNSINNGGVVYYVSEPNHEKTTNSAEIQSKKDIDAKRENELKGETNLGLENDDGTTDKPSSDVPTETTYR